jgi:Leucine-rich repeat (LRR) protein
LQLGDVLAVRLSYAAGFRGSDLSFLSLFPQLRSLEVYSPEVKELQPLSSLRKLEVLGLQTAAKIKFKNEWYPFLRVALLQWRSGMDELLSCEQLQYLNVTNLPFTDLLPLVKLSRLERLSITSRKLVALSGLECLRSLKELDLYACPNLASIELVAQCPNIVKLEVESCRHIASRR